MKIQKYKQSTIEGCLASNLLQLRYLMNRNKRNKITKNLEQNMLFHALKYCREDFVSGHLDFMEKKLNFVAKRYIHNKFLYGLVAKIRKKDLFQHKINIDFIDELLKKGPLILTIDIFLIHRQFHYPHWLLILAKEKKQYLAYEPWEGKEIRIKEMDLKDSLKSYLVRLWMAPQIITVHF